nr:MobF family relaxase [Jiangella muralis]
MTVSMRVVSAGDGYRYLLKSVAAGDGDRDLSTPLTRYYAETGAPPGRWIGNAMPDLGSGELASGDVVTEQQLGLLLGTGHDPVTGNPLGRAFPTYATRSERVHARIAALDPDISGDERAAAVTLIEAEETARGQRRAVAGYDFTFSVPKSVSALWAVADTHTQTAIVRAHHAAVADVIALMERDVAATRVGFSARDGAVAQVDVTGLVGTSFDHYDSRAGDPQLHTHVVISNKVRAVRDGRWRSLDGRPMHAAVVALSEHYNALLADRLTRELSVAWEQRGRGKDRNPAWELAAVPDELIAAFSSRGRDIDAATAKLIDSYMAEHGRRPSATTVIRLRAHATLATRPEKQDRSLAELTASWRVRASHVLGGDATTWAARVGAKAAATTIVRAEDVPHDAVTELGNAVVAAVGDRRSTWRYWNLHAEASRQTMGVRFATIEDREAVVGSIVDAAERTSLALTPLDLVSSPEEFRREDGSSVFRPKHSVVFSSTALLAAEDRLLQLAESTAAPAVDAAAVEVIARRRASRRLGDDQARAVAAVASSGRVVDVLIGPAGSGKTTAMNALRIVWEQVHGEASVIGLAPSAAAAQVLADDLGVPTENTAKWLHDHTAGVVEFGPGQLVILDEASLAGTHTLDVIASHAAEAGAKLVLVGDPHQLDAVDAGGAFRMLVHTRSDVAELAEVHRFRNDWEKHASLRLRLGDVTVIDTYLEHDRIRAGDAEQILDQAYNAWRADTAAGRQSVLIADTRGLVTTLNIRARLDRIVAGQVIGTWPVRLHDDTEASKGDVIVTRLNERRLTTGHGWVRNGDRWIVTATDRDGSLTVRQAGRRFGARVVLPAWYVADHVDLGYAVTTHQAQGLTVDTAHALVESSTTRENLYVAMTRGRDANIAYVVTDKADLEDHRRPPDDQDVTGRSVLYGVLRHVGAELSAHETLEVEQERWSSIAQLAAEYETLAAAAQHDRWTALIRDCGLTAAQVDAVLSSEAFGPLTAALRRAEAHGHDVDVVLSRLATARPLDDAEDIAAVLHYRITRATSRPSKTGHRHGRGSQAGLIARLIPEAVGPMIDDMRDALDQRRDLIEARATALAETAIADGQPWTRALGVTPRDSQLRRAWFAEVRVVAAYRDRYQITTANPLGVTVESTSQQADATLARAALRAARELAAAPPNGERGSVSHTAPDSSVRRSL